MSYEHGIPICLTRAFNYVGMPVYVRLIDGRPQPRPYRTTSFSSDERIDAIAIGRHARLAVTLLQKAMRMLQGQLPNIEIKLSTDYSPALWRRALDARIHAHASSLVYTRVRTEPLIVVFPSDHRLAARKAIRLREILQGLMVAPVIVVSDEAIDLRFELTG